MSVCSSPSFISIYLPCYLQLPSQTQIWACYSLTLNLQHNNQFPLHSRQFPPHPHLNILLLGFLQLFLSTGDQITHQPLQSCGFFSGVRAFGHAAASSQISLSPQKIFEHPCSSVQTSPLLQSLLTLPSSTAHFCTSMLCIPLNHQIYTFTYLSSNLQVIFVSSSIPFSFLTPSTIRDTH